LLLLSAFDSSSEQVASEHFSTLERLTFVIDKIARCLQRYQDFEVMFRDHQQVRQAIRALWVDLIWLCTRVIKYHSSRFRYLIVPFEKEFGSVMQSIDLHCAEADHAAAAAHMKEAKDIRERVLIETQGNQPKLCSPRLVS
jgi:hypothetical protein